MVEIRTSGIVAAHVRRRVVLYLFGMALLALGLSTGALASQELEPAVRSTLTQYLQGFLAAGDHPGSAAQTFFAVIEGGVLKTGLLMWLLGLSVIGAPLVCALVFLRGFALGFSLSILIGAATGESALAAFSDILPQVIFTIPAVLLCATGALAYAQTAARRLLGANDPPSVVGAFFSTTTLVVLGEACFVAAGFTQAYLAPWLNTWL